MQKYVALGPLRAAHPGDEINEHIWCAAPEVDAVLAAKDRDLADANHALLLANSNADAFRRVAEGLRSALQLIRDNVSHAGNAECGLAGVHIVRLSCEQYDAIDKVLKTSTGASNG